MVLVVVALVDVVDVRVVLMVVALVGVVDVSRLVAVVFVVVALVGFVNVRVVFVPVALMLVVFVSHILLLYRLIYVSGVGAWAGPPVVLYDYMLAPSGDLSNAIHGLRGLFWPISRGLKIALDIRIRAGLNLQSIR